MSQRQAGQEGDGDQHGRHGVLRAVGQHHRQPGRDHQHGEVRGLQQLRPKLGARGGALQVAQLGRDHLDVDRPRVIVRGETLDPTRTRRRVAVVTGEPTHGRWPRPAPAGCDGHRGLLELGRQRCGRTRRQQDGARRHPRLCPRPRRPGAGGGDADETGRRHGGGAAGAVLDRGHRDARPAVGPPAGVDWGAAATRGGGGSGPFGLAVLREMASSQELIRARRRVLVVTERPAQLPRAELAALDLATVGPAELADRMTEYAGAAFYVCWADPDRVLRTGLTHRPVGTGWVVLCLQRLAGLGEALNGQRVFDANGSRSSACSTARAVPRASPATATTGMPAPCTPLRPAPAGPGVAHGGQVVPWEELGKRFRADNGRVAADIDPQDGRDRRCGGPQGEGLAVAAVRLPSRGARVACRAGARAVDAGEGRARVRLGRSGRATNTPTCGRGPSSTTTPRPRTSRSWKRCPPCLRSVACRSSAGPTWPAAARVPGHLGGSVGRCTGPATIAASVHRPSRHLEPGRSPRRRHHRWGLGAYALAEVVFLATPTAIGLLVPTGTPAGAGLIAVTIAVPTVLAAGVALAATRLRGAGPAVDLGLRWSWDDVRLGAVVGGAGLLLTLPALMIYAAVAGPTADSAVGEVFGEVRAGPVAAAAVFVGLVVLAPGVRGDRLPRPAVGGVGTQRCRSVARVRRDDGAVRARPLRAGPYAAAPRRGDPDRAGQTAPAGCSPASWPSRSTTCSRAPSCCSACSGCPCR